MKSFFLRMRTSKAFWTCITAIVSSGGAYALGEIALDSFVQTAATALIGIFLRDGIAKNEPPK